MEEIKIIMYQNKSGPFHIDVFESDRAKVHVYTTFLHLI